MDLGGACGFRLRPKALRSCVLKLGRDTGEAHKNHTTQISKFISLENTVVWLRANTPLQQAEIYLCGPKPFMRDLVTGLLQHGIPADRIHYEIFGPSDEDLAA